MSSRISTFSLPCSKCKKYVEHILHFPLTIDDIQLSTFIACDLPKLAGWCWTVQQSKTSLQVAFLVEYGVWFSHLLPEDSSTIYFYERYANFLKQQRKKILKHVFPFSCGLYLGNQHTLPFEIVCLGSACFGLQQHPPEHWLMKLNHLLAAASPPTFSHLWNRETISSFDRHLHSVCALVHFRQNADITQWV